jgi:ribonuclease R
MMIPMLPEILCEKICSLHPGVDKLAFSVFFNLHKNGELVKDSSKLKKKFFLKYK